MSGLNDIRYRLHVATCVAIYRPFFIAIISENAKVVETKTTWHGAMSWSCQVMEIFLGRFSDVEKMTCSQTHPSGLPEYYNFNFFLPLRNHPNFFHHEAMPMVGIHVWFE